VIPPQLNPYTQAVKLLAMSVVAGCLVGWFADWHTAVFVGALVYWLALARVT
jgi:hypothetical protein